MAKTDRGYGPLDNHMYMYDLGWLVETILSFREELDTAIDLKTIHYADPIQWDITTQYSPNTVVVDPKTGTAYMSKVPVPAGVQLDNTDYWVVIFNYQRIYDKIMSGVAFNDKENAEASKDISKYDFVWFGGDLYQAQRDIPQGSKYVPGVNIVATTVADALATYYGRDRVAQVINETLTASETQTIGAKNRVINVTGDQTVTAGDIAETSANRTIKTTADYHIDVDGNLSDHVDGVTTVNRGGAVTKAYGSSLDVGVTGTYTAAYSGAVTETYKGKRNVTAKDTTLTASGTVTASANQFNLTSATLTFPIRFPDKEIDLYNLKAGIFKSVEDYGAVGNGSTDDTEAIKKCLAENDLVFFPPKTYVVSGSLVLHSGSYIFSNGAKIVSSAPEYTFICNGNSTEEPNTDITIKGLSISGIYSASKTPVAAIFLIRCKNIVLDGILVEKVNQAIRVAESTNVHISNITTHAIKRTSDRVNGYGIITQDTKSVYINECDIEAERHGIYSYLFNNTFISRCRLTGSAADNLTGYEYAVKFGGGTNGYVSDCDFSDVYGGVEFSHNQINTAGSKNITVSDCRFRNMRNNPKKAMGWIYTVENEQLSKNIVVNNCAFENSTGRDININAGSSYKISNCIFKYGTSSFAAIRIVGQEADSINNIIGNTIIGYPIALDISTTLTGTFTDNNLLNTPLLAENSTLKNMVIKTNRFNTALSITTDNPNIWGRDYANVSGNLTKLIGGNIGDILTLAVPAGSSVGGNIKVKGGTFTGIQYGTLQIIKRTDADWNEIARYPAS